MSGLSTRCLTVTAVTLFLLAVVADAKAQFADERFVGTVQWISGQRLALALDDGTSIPVDLTNVDQGAYQDLGPGDRIVVMGRPSPDRDRLIATSIATVSQ
jgi:hypothetical protein